MIKNLYKFLVVSLISINFFGCSESDELINTKNLKKFNPISFSDNETRSIKGVQDFSWNLFKAVNEQESGNFMISPLSASLNLAMLANGTDGETKKQIIGALDVVANDVGYINSYANKIISKINTLDNSANVNIYTHSL